MKETYKVLVDLDAILDTRLATLASIDMDIANEVGQSPAYLNRYCDYLSKVDKRIDDKHFRDRYLKRNASILPFSLMTDVIHLLCIGFKDMLPAIYRGISPKDTSLEVNTYPYKLDEKTKQLIEAAILYHIPYEIAVKMVYIDNYALTPQLLRSTYQEWYTYDIEPWIVIHTEAILARPFTKVQIVLPKLSTSGNDPQAESFGIDPFKARELLFKPSMSLNYIDLKFFTYNHEFTDYLHQSGFFDRPDVVPEG